MTNTDIILHMNKRKGLSMGNQFDISVASDSSSVSDILKTRTDKKFPNNPRITRQGGIIKGLNVGISSN